MEGLRGGLLRGSSSSESFVLSQRGTRTIVDPHNRNMSGTHSIGLGCDCDLVLCATYSVVVGKQVRSATRAAAPKAARVVAVTASAKPVWFPGNPGAPHLNEDAPGYYGWDPLGLSKWRPIPLIHPITPS
eukprot:17910-Prorocentrum_minimum.AAC.1